MPEETTQAVENAEETKETTAEESSYHAPETQAELDRIIEKRLQRERAKYEDYDQLKAKVASLGEVVAERDTLKSQLDTVNTELGGYRKAEQVRTWAKEVSSETGVPAEALRGATKEEMLAHAKTLEKYVKVSAPVVEGDGKSPSAQAGLSNSEVFAETFKNMI